MIEAVLAGELVIIAGLGLLAVQLHDCAKAMWVQAQAMNALTETLTMLAERLGAVESEVEWPID